MSCGEREDTATMLQKLLSTSLRASWRWFLLGLVSTVCSGKLNGFLRG